eukprot:TRINITY_DN2377_c0_g3_i1.p1 TRINITY_DN2377_c0_g3~~TRINITY_DN2377_c0_g3_i1.p1  ORF type:complete len:251 (+),score=71.24 TRINITY_DN2377_c0_g3_i1:64-753(+)
MSLPTLVDASRSRSFHPLLPAVAGWIRKISVAKFDRVITRFSGSYLDTDSMPPVDGFLYRLCVYGYCSPEVFMRMAVYLSRYMHSTGQLLTQQNVHRMIIAAFLLAVKQQDDHNYTNAYYARVAGITLQEINGLECAFLIGVDWELEVTYATYTATLRCLECSAYDPHGAMAQGIVGHAIQPVSAFGHAKVRPLRQPSSAESSVGPIDSSEGDGSPWKVRVDACRKIPC